MPEVSLTKLVAGPGGGLPTSSLAQIAFSRDDPNRLAVGAQSGLFYSPGGGQWVDFTTLLPLPRSAITSVAIDCEAIYMSLDARSLVRVVDYKVMTD